MFEAQTREFSRDLPDNFQKICFSPEHLIQEIGLWLKHRNVTASKPHLLETFVYLMKMYSAPTVSVTVVTTGEMTMLK